MNSHISSSAKTPQGAEGDVNHSPRRKVWHDKNIDKEAQELLRRDEKVFLHQSVSTPCLSVIKKAEGIWIEDNRGHRFMDFHGNNVHHIGYGHPRLKQAIKQQLDDLPFAPRRFTCDPAVELAEKLTDLAPGDLNKVLFATGGSDAIEIALAYARAKTGRFKTISFWDSFHGAGFGARSIGGEEMFRSGPIGPLLPGTEHVPPFGDYRNAWGVTEGSAELCANTIRYVLEKEGDVAAVIAEPTRAVPYVAPPGFWKKVREACNDFGALLIFDEIPTGLGKTGKMFSCEYDDVIPDILVVGKSLGGGILPIAATICRPELDIADRYAYGHYTHEKNPVTTRAALTTLQIIEDEGLVENAAKVGAYALERLQEMQQRHPLIGDVRGRGCLFGAELVTDRDTREPANDAADMVLYAALDKGLSFKTTMGNVLTFTPSLVTTQQEMENAMDIIDACLAEVEIKLGYQ
ncbi:aspartate aminotransferase family protein [uncultured Kiloniella sp.]|uniref:(R)-1-hydroxy-2-aminoethylphosphonate ammonia-lyase n=1 Tax=uncultured Kiloniella sp. TaxID=1133091 RepID=UPI0026033E55|nr:aspartate aminotransferase family protein [uncultured Kiloniella sp.]